MKLVALPIALVLFAATELHDAEAATLVKRPNAFEQIAVGKLEHPKPATLAIRLQPTTSKKKGREKTATNLTQPPV